MTGVSLRSEDEQLVAAKAKELARSRDVSGQTIVDEQYHFDVTIDWLYKPHTISAIIVVVGTLIYFAFNTESQVYDAVTNTKIGILGASFCLLMLGLLVFPTGPFIRPHPLFWRFTFGIGVLYQLFLTILLFQKRDDARHLLTYLDPRLNQPLRERTYADQCELTWANVSPNIFDRFFVAHFVGWVIKAMMLRDYALCWAISISWEVIEVAFLHMLPNFAECWWDQWILDVLVMNGLGIYVGHKLCDYLEVRRYEWSGVRDIPALTGKVKRVLMQFTPERWTRVRWEATTSVKRFFALHLVVFFFQLEELNAFFLKAILWIPPEVNLNAYRLAIWTFLGLPIGRQLYAFITDPACQRIGNHTFLGAVLLSTEVLIIVKFGAGMFPNPPSDFQIKFVGAFCVLWLVACVLILRRIMTKRAGDHLSTPPIAPVSVAEWPPAQALAHPATASAVVGHSAGASTGGWVSADLLSDASRPVSRAGSRAASPLASPLATPAASPPASPRHAAAAAAAAAALPEFTADAGAADVEEEEEEAPAPRGRRSIAAAPVPVAKRTRSSSRLSTTPQRASSRNVRG